MRTVYFCSSLKMPQHFFAFGLTVICLTLILCQSTLSQESPTKKYWKGNLHTHSFWSDGTDFPEMIAQWYVEHDYHFLALSDHNILSRGERWMDVNTVKSRGGEDCLAKYKTAFGDDVDIREKEIDAGENDSEEKTATTTEVRLKTLAETSELFDKPGQFIMIESEEISDSFNRLPVHMNALNLEEVLRPAGGQSVRDTIRNNMRLANEQASKLNREILVHLNHPNFGWAVTPEDLAAIIEEQFFEIFNGHPSVNQLGDDTRPSLEKFWDVVNTLRIAKLDAPPAYGLGVDDSHEYHGRGGSHPGRAWVMVKAETLAPDDLIKSMKEGDFYSSSGITLKGIKFDKDSKTLSIEIDDEEGVTYSTQFIGTLKEFEVWDQDQQADSEQDEKQLRKYSDDIGQTFKTQNGTSVSYQLTGEELYVRALITSDKPHPDPSFDNQFEQAWSQPFGWR